MAKFWFLYATDNDDDDGCRLVEGATMEEARLEWVRQVTAEGQTVHLSAIQGVKS